MSLSKLTILSKTMCVGVVSAAEEAPRKCLAPQNSNAYDVVPYLAHTAGMNQVHLGRCNVAHTSLPIWQHSDSARLFVKGTIYINFALVVIHHPVVFFYAGNSI